MIAIKALILAFITFIGSLYASAPPNQNLMPLRSCYSGVDNWRSVQVIDFYTKQTFSLDPSYVRDLEGVQLHDTYILPEGNSTIFTDIAWIDLDQLEPYVSVEVFGDFMPLSRFFVYRNQAYGGYVILFVTPSNYGKAKLLSSECFFYLDEFEFVSKENL